MNLKLIRTEEARDELGKNFLARAVQDFNEVQRHDDWALSSIQILRRIPSNEHYLSKRQSRYVF